jgi:hypothetical protein
MRAVFLAIASCFLVACNETHVVGDAGRGDVGVDAGPSCTILLEDPDDGLITSWPDQTLVVPDPTTFTGERIVISETEYPDLFMRLAGYRSTITIDLAEADGFGVTAEAFFQFGRAFDETMLPTPEETATPAGGIGFVVLEPGPPRIVPVILDTNDEGATLFLGPMTPLPPHGVAAAFVTRALTDAGRGCLEPSEAEAASFASPTTEDAMAIAALTDLGVIGGTEDLVALTTFHTQSITETGLAVREDVAGRTFDWAPGMEPDCHDETAYTVCEGAFVAGDYRDADGVVRLAVGETLVPVSTYTIPVTIYLPLGRTGPVPTFVYGHGLTGDRHQAGRLADFAAPAGYATIAIDAAEHGEHPTVEDGPRDTIPTLLAFFGVNTAGDRSLEAARLRDNFAGSAFDRLQLAALFEAHPDVDGDGTDDLDMSQFAYLGVSLGGIMGPQELALDDRLGAGVLVVPGGRVSTIISDSALFSALVEALRPRGTTRGDVRRFFPILQTILDRGDPAAWAPYLLQSRLPGITGLPSILCGVVLDDDTVPNVSNYVLGRAIGVPIVAPLLRPEPGFEVVPAPLSGNFTLGSLVATGGLLQFDVRSDPAGGTEMATHSNVGDSDVGAEAWLHFLSTHFDGGLAEIADPYAALGVPHATP